MRQIKEVKQEDIAKALNISIVSVSNALNGRKGVGEELRRKVKEKARELGYQPLQTAAAKSQRPCQIGVMIARRYVKDDTSFYMDIYKYIALEAVREDCVTSLIIRDEEMEISWPEPGFLPQDMEMEGMIFIGKTDREFIRRMREQLKVPMAGIGFYDLDRTIDYVFTDDFHAGQQITHRLIRAGHKNIAFAGNQLADCGISDCYMGYCKALWVNGLKEKEYLAISENGEEQDFELPEDMPTAYIVHDRQTAELLVNKFYQRGLRVPEDVSVAASGHIGGRVLGSLVLSGYENSNEMLARTGIRVLKEKMENEKSERRLWMTDACFIEGNTIRRLDPC